MTEKEAVYYELLVLRCRRRQEDALEELVRTWDRPLLYYIRRLVEDEHESLQILQQTWVKVLQGLGRLREPRKLPLWLYSIARKTALSHLRSRYSEQALFCHDTEGPGDRGRQYRSALRRCRADSLRPEPALSDSSRGADALFPGGPLAGGDRLRPGDSRRNREVKTAPCQTCFEGDPRKGGAEP